MPSNLCATVNEVAREALTKLHEMTNVPQVRILEHLLMTEYDAVLAGKAPSYGRVKAVREESNG